MDSAALNGIAKPSVTEAVTMGPFAVRELVCSRSDTPWPSLELACLVAEAAAQEILIERGLLTGLGLVVQAGLAMGVEVRADFGWIA